IVAAGVKTTSLLKKMDTNIPSQPGKGSSFDVQRNRRGIHITALLMEGRVAVSTWGNRLRVSGTMEIGGDPHTIYQAKIRGILKTLHAFYPDLKAEIQFPPQIWTGARPCAPDGLPFIGRLK